ncbi:hypothetical protein NQ314_010917 [Rhamnusium bicolor]|uniref:N-acetyltransferase domain-containing protein n=1 Tax=Rhamnusium bicolor TaxID=1586634 RepID=A0AAV8XM37_9CUCU|nr:hypothetical protein NQ314_010917 [Rhamnusium bicolor]
MIQNAEFLDGALNVMREGFYPDESACTALGLPQHPEAISELEELTIRTSRDGVSVIAIESATQKVVGAAFNKLQVKNNSEDGSYFENYAKSCKYSSSRGLVKFMIDADAACDMFEYCHVDCLLEIMFLGTLPEFRKSGIGKKLCEVSTEIARSLLRGDNIKQPMNGKELPLEPVPKIVSALFTSPTSQRIGRSLGWEIVARISYEKFFHEGKTFASILGKDIPDTTLEFKRL